MKWIKTAPRHGDRILPRRDAASDTPAFGGDFNLSFSEVGTGCSDVPAKPDADDDIRAGRTKSFSNVDEMLGSLKHPW